jgi:hypothetical protein
LRFDMPGNNVSGWIIGANLAGKKNGLPKQAEDAMKGGYGIRRKHQKT